MSTEKPAKNKIGAFIIGTCFGALLSIIPLWAVEVESVLTAAVAVTCIAVPLGLIAAFACPKKFEKAVAYFLTITNP